MTEQQLWAMEARLLSEIRAAKRITHEEQEALEALEKRLYRLTLRFVRLDATQ